MAKIAAERWHIDKGKVTQRPTRLGRFRDCATVPPFGSCGSFATDRDTDSDVRRSEESRSGAPGSDTVVNRNTWEPPKGVETHRRTRHDLTRDPPPCSGGGKCFQPNKGGSLPVRVRRLFRGRNEGGLLQQRLKDPIDYPIGNPVGS